MATDVLCVPYEQKSNPLATLRTRGESFTSDAGDLVRVGVLSVVNDRVDSRLLYCVARLGRTRHSILFSTEPTYFALPVAQTSSHEP